MSGLEEFELDGTSGSMKLNPKIGGGGGGEEGEDDYEPQLQRNGGAADHDGEDDDGLDDTDDDDNDDDSFAGDDDDDADEDDGMIIGEAVGRGDKGDHKDDDSNADGDSADENEDADNDEGEEGEGEGDGDGDGDEDEDEDDIEDANKFKKFNQALRSNYITETHPESASHNDDEIHSLAHVVRDQLGAIIDPLHRTIPILTKYEKTRILGVRTKQINEGAPPYVSVKSTIIDGYIIAMRELEEKKIPFIVRRPLPNGGSEYWYLQDLEII